MSALRDFALFCGAIVAIITALTLVLKLPPIRWMGRHLVSDPLAAYAAGIIKDGAMQFHEETVRPQINQIEVKVDALVASETSWQKDKAWMVGRMERCELRVEQIDTQQKEMISGVLAVLEKDEGRRGDVIAGVTAALNGVAREAERD